MHECEFIDEYTYIGVHICTFECVYSFADNVHAYSSSSMQLLSLTQECTTQTAHTGTASNQPVCSARSGTAVSECAVSVGIC